MRSRRTASAFSAQPEIARGSSDVTIAASALRLADAARLQGGARHRRLPSQLGDYAACRFPAISEWQRHLLTTSARAACVSLAPESGGHLRSDPRAAIRPRADRSCVGRIPRPHPA